MQACDKGVTYSKHPRSRLDHGCGPIGKPKMGPAGSEPVIIVVGPNSAPTPPNRWSPPPIEMATISLVEIINISARSKV